MFEMSEFVRILSKCTDLSRANVQHGNDDDDDEDDDAGDDDEE